MNNILIFGGGELQLSIIKNVQKLGYRAIVIDPNPHAIARDVADMFIEVAGDDLQRTIEIARTHKVQSVATAATDNPLPMMALVAKELGLRFPTYESVSSVLDKGKFKTILQKSGVPCAMGATYHIDEEPDVSKLSFPVIIKPNKNSGSRGVVKCNNKDELCAEILQIATYCRDGKYIVEDFIEGDEISVEGLVIDGKLNIIQITDKYLSPPPYNVEMAHVQPSKYWYLKRDIQTIIQKIIDITGLNHCAVHPELKINSKGIFIIELGPRLGGDYITSDLVPLSTGINIEQELIKLSLGLATDLQRKDGAAMIQYLSLPAGTVIQNTISEESLKAHFPYLSRFAFYPQKGDTIGEITNSLNRHGWWILSGNSAEILLEESHRIQDIIALALRR